MVEGDTLTVELVVERPGEVFIINTEDERGPPLVDPFSVLDVIELRGERRALTRSMTASPVRRK